MRKRKEIWGEKKTAQSTSEFVVIFQPFLYLLSSSSYTGVKPDLPVLLCAPRPVPALLSGFYHSHLLAPNSLPPRSSSSLWDPCRHRPLPPHRRWRTTETQRIAAVQLFLVYIFFFTTPYKIHISLNDWGLNIGTDGLRTLNTLCLGQIPKEPRAKWPSNVWIWLSNSHHAACYCLLTFRSLSLAKTWVKNVQPLHSHGLSCEGHFICISVAGVIN